MDTLEVVMIEGKIYYINAFPALLAGLQWSAEACRYTVAQFQTRYPALVTRNDDSMMSEDQRSTYRMAEKAIGLATEAISLATGGK